MQIYEDRVVYRFGPFELDPAGRRLTREGRPLCLTPKGLDLLVALIESRGNVVERDVLMDRLWPDTVVVDANLTQTVSVLRKALGDTASDHLYIATVPGRGYQFTAPVEAVAAARPETRAGGESRLDGSADETGGPLGAGFLHPPGRAGRFRAVMGLLALVATLGIVALLAVGSRGSGAESGPEEATHGGGLAYQELILGRAARLERTRGGWAAAVGHFERALEHDPDYAPALAHLALARALLATNGVSGGSSRRLLQDARTQALRAIELAPELPEAHQALGLVRMLEDYDWAGAIAAIEEAVRLDPTAFRGHYLLSMALILAGDDERAWVEARRLRLDGRVTGSPLDVNHEYSAGILTLYLGRPQEAREALARMVAQRPDLGGVRMMLALSLDALGQRAEALAELEKAAPIFSSGNLGWATLAHYLGRSGDPAQRARAREILDDLERAPADTPSADLNLAVAHAGAGSKEAALRHLWRAHEARAVLPIVVLRDPRLDPLRDHPEFLRLLEAMNLAADRSRPDLLTRASAVAAAPVAE